MAPVMADGLLVAVTESGHLMVLDAASVSQLWNRRLLDGVVGAPAVAHGAVFVASVDQHLYAFDLGSRIALWQTLTPSPLVDPPVVIDDTLYQQVAAEGLVAFVAIPRDKFGGERRWTAAEVRGSVIGRHQGRLMVWDAHGRALTLVDPATGDTIDSVHLPKVKLLTVEQIDSGELYAVGDNGEVTRLVPRQ
jgi:outer membrane protein assembly factor BamB